MGSKSKRQAGFTLVEVLIVIVVVVVIALIAGGFIKKYHKSKLPDANTSTATASQSTGGQAQDTGVTITTSPVDISQISQISKFRSCFGHNFSAADTDGVVESDRSMKHYFQVVSSLSGYDKVKIVAPFDGIVVMADSSLDAPFGWQMAVSPAANPTQEMVIFHIDPAPGIGVNSKIKAGQLLGYTHPPDGLTFDIAYGWPVGNHPIPQTLDSLFNHMSKSVLAQYAQRGLTPANAVISKAQRDAQPCDYPNGQIGSPLAGSPDNWVVLQ